MPSPLPFEDPMAKVLIPPTVEETPADIDDWFLSRIKIHRGVSIIKRHDGTFYSARFPAQTEIEESAKVWLGGHEHPLTDEEAEDLTSAGYGEYIHDN